MTNMKMVHIYLGEELKEKVKEKAKEKGLSVGSFIRMVLIEKVEESKKGE